MKIANLRPMVSFGRALTSDEKRDFKEIQNAARKKLNIDKTAATIFDFSVPSSKNDTGIGTSFSKDAQELGAFLNSMVGVNAIQLQPQGQISNFIRSPYSGTGFSLGMHIIDLNKLADDDYSNLLSDKDLKAPYMNRVKNHDSVDYDNVFSTDGQKAMLQKAYKRFLQLDSSSPLKKEYESFKKENSYWLEKDALFEAAAVANNSSDMKSWPNIDKYLFEKKEGNAQRIAQLKYVTDDKGNNVVDFEEFVQFIADKQQKQSKNEFNKQGIDIYGDCQIGFSQKDFWAHRSAFYPNYEFGCDIGNNNYSCWSPAINFEKLNSDAGELLYNKFNLFFKRYNGVRIDAAWQLIKPLICEPIKNNGQDVFDSNGNKLGYKLHYQPVVPNNGQKIIKDIVLKAADNNKVPHDKVFLELLGGNSYDSLDSVKHLGATLIHITRYASDGWGRVKYYESRGDNKYQNMRPGQYIIGPGTHDDDSLVARVKQGQLSKDNLASDLHLNRQELKDSPAAASSAVFAELFTTKNQFATLPDILGSERRFNTPNTKEGNWAYRAPVDFEREYFQNLNKGMGLNIADAYSKALKAKNHGYSSSLTQKLDDFAQILKEDGPMTTKDADKFCLTHKNDK